MPSEPRVLYAYLDVEGVDAPPVLVSVIGRLIEKGFPKRTYVVSGANVDRVRWKKIKGGKRVYRTSHDGKKIAFVHSADWDLKT